VSTDSNEIAEVARSYSVDVPFIRPHVLSSDTALAVDVLKHAITHEEKRLQIRFDYVVMLQPTTPLKLTEDIDGAINKLIQTGCESVVTMVDVGANHPARMYKIDNDKLVGVMDEGIAMRPRQELTPIYIRNGAVYAFRREVIDKYNALLGNDVRPYVMPTERSVNIDNLLDLYLAEYLISVSK
jgi:CMP-N-acetylneuraminic acid synthetase